MELIEIEAFIAISETSSFTRAAERLHRSQPAVSRRIDLLENELGVPLFERVSDGVRLTDAGSVFLPYARRVLAAARDGALAVAELESGAIGEVALALVGTLASTSLTGRLSEFRDENPAVRLRLMTALSDQVEILVERGEATFGLRYFAARSSALRSVCVENEPLIVVCSTRFALDRDPISRPEQLAGVPWVGFPTNVRSSGEPFTRVLQRQLARAGLDDAEMVAIDSLTAQKRVIEAGFGIGLMPESSVQEELRLGSLVVLPLPAIATTVPIHAVYRADGHLSPAAKRLLAMLTSEESA